MRELSADQGLRGKDISSVTTNPASKDSQPRKSKQSASVKKHASSLLKFLSTKLDDNCHVNPRHIFIKVENPQRVFIGIDDLVSIILGSIDEVVLPQPGEKIKNGAPSAMWGVMVFKKCLTMVNPSGPPHPALKNNCLKSAYSLVPDLKMASLGIDST